MKSDSICQSPSLVATVPTFFTKANRFLATFVLLVALDLAHVSKAGELVPVATPAELFPLTSVRLLDGPFTRAAAANREYLLALEPDRLLAPYRREAGLEPRKPSYGNWESSGLDGHTAGHYLSALANMIAAGDDTSDGELRRRLDYMVNELANCQNASADGYVGGVPGSRELWSQVMAGHIEALNRKWVPWYNLHKMFAGLRDAYLVAGNERARDVLVGLGDWCDRVTGGLSDEQMQRMLGMEQGGMNEVMADLYVIAGDKKYLNLARRLCHKAVLDPLEQQEDRLTGLHANTQIPKVIGLERIATITGDRQADAGARFFWETVTGHRSVAFGGNSVSEHFNATNDFGRMIESREGPETCNSYNMLRLTEQLFAAKPSAACADYYERTLYNHILASINPDVPGYVYFTPIRPEHYRVYSQPDQCFWCCVGTGMENPGKYGEFIYARAKDGLYVNLFIASELKVPEFGLGLRQETKFPDEPRTRLRLQLTNPATFSLRLRHPAWVKEKDFVVRINGQKEPVVSAPSAYAEIRREWHDGDLVEIELPMRTTVERLPDGSDWVAILYGPILLAATDGTNDLTGLRADDARMGHVAYGPTVPLDQVPVLLTTEDQLTAHVVADPSSGPLHFRLKEVAQPPVAEGISLSPFFRIQDQRYQIYWQLCTAEKLTTRHEQIAVAERAKAAREAATLDSVAIGEQQPEVEHDFQGQSNTGMFDGRRWRDGQWFQYTLNARRAKAVDVEATYWGSDGGRTFDVFANGELIATEELTGQSPGRFIQHKYPLPAEVLAKAKDGLVTIKFVAKVWVAGGVFDLRLMKSETAPPPSTVIDQVTVGDQGSETNHAFVGEESQTGMHKGRNWRTGTLLQYTLRCPGEKMVDLIVTYWGGDSGRTFDIWANDKLLATERLIASEPNAFIEKKYSIPADVLAAAKDGYVTVKFVAKILKAGSVFDVRLVRPRLPEPAAPPRGTP